MSRPPIYVGLHQERLEIDQLFHVYSVCNFAPPRRHLPKLIILHTYLYGIGRFKVFAEEDDDAPAPAAAKAATPAPAPAAAPDAAPAAAAGEPYKISGDYKAGTTRFLVNISVDICCLVLSICMGTG